MSTPKFKLGQKVRLDPLETGRGPEGKILAILNYIDGSVGYRVVTRGHDAVIRHELTEYEITAIEEES